MSHKKHKAGITATKLPETGTFFDWTKSEKYLEYAITFFSLSIILVLFAQSEHFFYSKVFMKEFLFYGFIEIIVALYLALALINKRYWPRIFAYDENGRRNINWLLILPSAYIGAAILSTLFAVNRYGSFFGSVSYNNGLLVLLHFWALFIVLSSVFQKKKFWLWFLRLNVLVGSFMAFFALYQKFIKGTVVMGTFGNQGHLSIYLVFIAALSAVLFFWEERRDVKLCWVSSGIISVLTLFLATDIRGSQLGFLVGICSAIAVYFLAHQRRSVRQTAACLIFIVLSSVIIFSVYMVSSGKVYSLFQRSGTVKTRVLNWKISWKGFLDRPVFGYGLENYYIVFEKYFEPSYYQNNNGQQSTEYGFSLPHNKVIEVAVLSGIPGFVTYLAIFFGIFSLLYRKFKKTRDMKLLVLFGMWSAYLAHLFFLFDNIVSFYMFFSLLAFTYFTLSKPPEKRADQKVVLNPFLSYAILAGILVATAGAVYFFSIQAARASHYAIKAIFDMQDKKYEESFASFEKMEKVGIFYISQKGLFELSRQVEKEFALQKQFSDLQEGYIKKIIAKNDASLAADPSQLYYLINMSRLYYIAGKFDKANYEKSNELLQKMVDNGSKRMEAYMYQATNYKELGQKEKAAEYGEKAVALDPTYGFATYGLAFLYNTMEEEDKALFYAEETIKNGFSNESFYNVYADIARKINDHDRQIIAFTKLTQLNPKNAQNFANLAMVYFEKKDYQKSREVSEDIIRRFPNLKGQIQAFIDKLPK